ncbi:MFS transporter [Parashewanella curva]|uniref:MFS transporter n=1 Tax=Parashewanella curva TaxID=2338552 RepID=A0A3L8Q0X2_9GAMM|nr:oligopeptide:H+ symporter [Parashewanella curva]RLV60042.1 MFS transporter [Parashewanella curva]
MSESSQQPVSKTRSFATICLIEVWERFGFYGMQALIIYFMIQRLGFEDSRANLVWSAAAALIYVSPAIGGWVGDQILGTKRTMTLGAIILSVGYGLMTIPTSNTWFLFYSLGVIVVGNGLFKPNAGNIVRMIYHGDDSKIDSAFTIYYMAVNVGSTVSMLLSPLIKEILSKKYGVDIGWHGAFSVSCVGLIIGLAQYFAMKPSLQLYGSEPDQNPVNLMSLIAVLAMSGVTIVASAYILNYESLARLFVYGAILVILGIFIYLISKSEHKEKAGLIVALILTVQTVFFFVFYQQMSTSLALFALRNVDANFYLFGYKLWTWQPAQFMALNPIWIMLLSPLLAWLYNWVHNKNINFPIAVKFMLGFVVVAIGFFIFGFAGEYAVAGKTSSWVMIWGYGAYSLGELLVSGLGLAMIARYAPARMAGFMMGAYFVASGSSQYLGGIVANFASVPKNLTDPLQSLPIYTDLFTKLGIAAVVCTLISLALLPKMNQLTKEHQAHN